MLEIAECYVISDQLNQTINGKVIQNVYANSSPHKFAFYFGEPKNYHKLLSGRTVDSVTALAGYIEITLGNAKILIGEGTNTRYFKCDDDIPKKHQLHIEFEDFSSLVCTVQMYGCMWAYKEGENDNYYYTVAKQNPSPLCDEFNWDYFQNIINNAKPNLSAKALIAAEQRIPGLGNGTMQDILFNSGINPKRKIDTLSDADKKNLFVSIKRTIFDMAVKGGRDTEKDIFGIPGGYTTILSKKTMKYPCPICGETIIKQAYMGGNIYYCPTCQPI